VGDDRLWFLEMVRELQRRHGQQDPAGRARRPVGPRSPKPPRRRRKGRRRRSTRADVRARDRAPPVGRARLDRWAITAVLRSPAFRAPKAAPADLSRCPVWGPQAGQGNQCGEIGRAARPSRTCCTARAPSPWGASARMATYCLELAASDRSLYRHRSSWDFPSRGFRITRPREHTGCVRPTPR
jgi:hypothetical protein